MLPDSERTPARLQCARLSDGEIPVARMTEITALPKGSTGASEGASASAAPPRGWARGRRIVGDVIVVVVGILIAFTLDSWWTGRAAAQREEGHLRALRSDFEMNVERLTQAALDEEEISESSLRLLRLARAEAPLAPDTVRALLYRVFSSGRFSPVMGAYEALVNSGGLMQITDDTLRAALAQFASALETRYWEEYSTAQYLGFSEYVAGRTDFLIHGFLGPTIGDSTWVVPPASAVRDAELLQDPTFQHHLAIRYGAERDVAGSYRALGALAARILHRVNRLLHDSSS